MPFIPAGQTARVTIEQALFSQKISNVIYCRCDVPITAPSLLTLCQQIAAWWGTLLAPQVSPDLTLTGVKARDMSQLEAIGVEEVVSPAVPGTGTGASLPGNVALAIKLGTGLTGRSNHGRIYQSGLTEGSVLGNQVADGARTGLIAAYEGLKSVIDAYDYDLVVASFYHGMDLDPAPRPDGTIRRTPHPRDEAVVTPVTTISADNNTDSQRRRLNGRGI